MVKSILTAVLLLGGWELLAQQSVKQPVIIKNNITGKVKDNIGKPLEFASVLLLSAKDSSLVKGSMTDTTGIFEISENNQGSYLLSITSIGYQKFISEPVVISETSPIIDLGIITLAEDSKLLNTVVISGERPAIERQVDKILVNPNNSIFKASSNALDILGRSPGITLDAKGGISLKGSTPLIMIDGKNQAISMEELKALPPDAIEQIEIIGSAGAKYDGETRSVINIKLKRDKNLGLKGDSYVSTGQNRRYGSYAGGFSLTYKTKKMVYFGRYGYNNDNDFLDMTGNRNVVETNRKTIFNEANDIKFSSTGHALRVGADYQIKKQQTVGVLVKSNFTTGEQNSNNLTKITTLQDNQASTLQRLQTTNFSNSKGTSVAVNLNYRGTINKKGATLTADFDAANYDINRNQDFKNQYISEASQVIGIPTQLRNLSPSNTNFQSIKVDFSQPINKTMALDIGAKTSWSKSDNDLKFDTLNINQWVVDKSRSNRFLYEEHIIGAYTNISGEVGKNSFQVGLRIENTNTLGNSLTTDNVVDRAYFRWLPTAQVMHKFDDNNSVSLGYVRKLTRPTYYDLNPFKYYINPFSYTEGNPFLLPITRDVVEANYAYKDYSFGISYRNDSDVFAQMPVQNDVTKVLYYTRVNLNTQRTLSFDIYAPVKINDWWQMQHNISVYYRQVKSNYLSSSFNNTNWSYYIDGSQAFSVSKTFTTELSYYFSGPSASQFYLNQSYGEVALNFKKTILNKKADLTLNFTDIFRTYREKYAGQYLNIDVSTLQLRGTQAVKLRLNYRFGSSTFNRRNRNTGSSEEENRVKMN